MRRLFLSVDFFAILFAISAVLGTLTAYDRSLAYGLLATILGSVLLYLIVAHLGITWRAARQISVILIAATTCIALIFILQYDYQGFTDTPHFILQLGKLTTVLPDMNIFISHPNSLATLIEGALPLALVLAASRRRRAVHRIFGLVCSLILLYTLLLTFSRGALIGIIAAVLAAFLSRSRWFALFAGLSVLVLVAAFFVLYDLRNMSIVADIFAWTSGRFELYRNSLYVASDYLFTGIGLGNTFAMVYSRYGLLIQVPFLTYPHSLPLSVWMGQGLLGLIALAGLVISFYLLISRIISTTRPQSVFYGAWMGVTATLVHGLFDARQYVEAVWLMPVLFLLIGLSVASARLAISEIVDSERSYLPSPSLLRFAPAAVVIIVLVGSAAVFNRQLAAAWNTNQGALDETRGELAPDLTVEQRLDFYESARRHYHDALAADANWSNANRRLGNLNVNLRDFDEAVPLLEKAYAGEPGNPAAIKGLGLAYTWVGRIDDAVRMFNLMSVPLDMAGELDVWGFYRSQEQDYLLAAYAYETSQMMRSNQVRIPIWMSLGENYRRAEKLEDARRWYARVLEIEPNNLDALRALEEIDATG